MSSLEKSTYLFISSDVSHPIRMFSQTVVIADLDFVTSSNENHLINWEESNILAKDNERNTRWIRESIWIRRKGGTNYKRNLMNADEGPINLVIFMIS